MAENNLDDKVSLVWTDKSYPLFPYKSDSVIYKALKKLFYLLGLNSENPFANFIKAGEMALIKPNWVRDRNLSGYSVESLLSHPSLIKYLIDFLAQAMKGRGAIIIGDAPLQDCNLNNLIIINRVQDIIALAKNKYPGINFILEDWRLTKRNNGAQEFLDGLNYKGLKNYQLIDIGRESFIEDIVEYSKRFRVTCYKPSLMCKHHTRGKHEYLINNRILEADFVVNLAKMKTHVKAGVTGALKNFIGVNGHKEFLPHHIKGSYFEGGDSYCMPSWLKGKYEDLYDYFWEHFVIFSNIKRRFFLTGLQMLWVIAWFFRGDKMLAGSWQGNDTIWRAILDINHIIYFGSNQKKERKILNVIDGIVAGEGEGPLSPVPKPTGVLLAGENPAYVDAVMAKLMGYNVNSVPMIYNAINHRRSKFAGIALEKYQVNGKAFFNLPNLSFKKPKYWI